MAIIPSLENVALCSLTYDSNIGDNLPAVQLPINFINGYPLEFTQKFADELRVGLIDLFAF